jgi:hypothetical protein
VEAAVVVKLLGGIGLFLLGIHHLTEGLKGLSGDSLRRTLQRFVSGRFSAVTSGAVLTVATQSSTATILTVIGFVGAGLVTLSQAIAQALAAWLHATKDPQAQPAPAIFKALEYASKQPNADRKTGRLKLLEDVALQRTPAATARAALDTLAWADAALYHAWRLTESLRTASGR